ncbi:MAG: hypothetical protein AAGF11_48860 [Myxococcota bacterium]
MPHPYRPTEADVPSSARVLARRNRWRTIWHLGIIVALLCGAGWVMTTDLGRRVPWLWGAVAVFVSFDVVRTAHEATLLHRVRVDRRGIELAWCDKAAWRPWMRRRNVAIAWEMFIAAQVESVSINGSTTSTLSIVRRDGPPVTIPEGVFDLSSAQLQVALLDEREDRIEAPRREAADVAGYCRAFFAEPLTFRRRAQIAQPLGMTVIVGIGATMMGMAASVPGGWVQAVLTTGVVGLAGVLVYALWSPGSVRVLRLSEEGVGHGPHEARLGVVPWSDVRFARPTVVNGRVTQVVVAVREGASVILEGDYGAPLRELAMMIAPPVEMVLASRERARADSSG